MKTLLSLAAILLSSIFLQAQLPTNGLVAQYDMLTTGGGGTTLTDLSGNGNNGTINGTTTTSKGRVCNGTTDYISMPQLIGNSDFTVLAISTGSASGATWGESNAAASQFVRFGVTESSWTFMQGSGGATNLTKGPALFSPDWDVFFATRSQNQLSGGVLSRANLTWSAANVNIGTITVAGGGAGLCALNKGGSQSNFNAVTLAYLVLYSRHLSVDELKAAYQAIAAAVTSRNVFVHPWPASVMPTYTNPVWQRQGIVFSQAASAKAVTEPMVLYDSTCPLLLLANCFRLWYSANSIGIGYAESPDGKLWTNNGAAGTTILASIIQPSVLKVAGTYHLYGSTIAGTQFNHYTSADGFNSWVLVDAAILVPGTTGAWDDTKVNNAFVSFSPDGSGSWYMLYGGFSGGSGSYSSNWRTGGATSPDGHTWTKATANPFSGAFTDAIGANSSLNGSNPHLAYVNGTWWDWDGAWGIIRYASPVFNGFWIWSQPHDSIWQSSADESAQLADCTIVEVNGKTYIWYVAFSTNSSGVGVIKLAIANMPMSVLVTTAEGATTDWP